MTRNEKRLILGCLGFSLLSIVTVVLVVGGLFMTISDADDFGGPEVREAAEASDATEPIEATDSAQAAAVDREPIGEMQDEAENRVEYAQLPLPAQQPGEEPDLTELFYQVSPGVVSIGTRREITFGSQEALQAADGSGFILDDEHIVTNNHVVAGADRLIVTFADQSQAEAELVGTDSFSDLAVIRVVDIPASARALPLRSDFASLEVGQPVIAIGNPFGLENTMTFGIVSSLGRTIPSGATQFSIPETIQTDAAINPGNSGGPLIDMRGQVIGVNAQIRTTGAAMNSGVGFAIPASIVAKVAPVLASGDEYSWSYLGVTGTTLTLEIAEANQLDEAGGAYIVTVLPTGPAAAVLQGGQGAPIPTGGDVIVAIDGNSVESFDDLLSYIALETAPGQTVELRVMRNGRARNLEVTLAERPAEVEEPPSP